MTVRTFTRLAAVLITAFAWFMAAPLASANSDAEAFTRHLIDEGTSILRDSSGNDRREKFRHFISQYADVSWAAKFTLGAYGRGADKSALDAFTDAFREYATAAYESNLDKYKGQTLKVTGSVDNKPGDVTVDTVVLDGHGSSNGENALRVSFRLFGSGGSYKFVDVRVEGAWLAQSQREQFNSILGRNGGSIPGLTSELASRTERIRSGGVDHADRDNH
jgi:phospholipid transport system substrate-binding protein